MQLSQQYAPEETPYLHKYKAIEMLKLISQKQHPYQFVVECLLGDLYSEVEQTSDSTKAY